MSVNTIRCGLDGCESGQCQTIGNHVWSKRSIAFSGCLPTAIPTRTKYMSFYVDIDDRERHPDEIMIGVYDDINERHGVDVWMTVEEAERLMWHLGSAIRRHTGYRVVTK